MGRATTQILPPSLHDALPVWPPINPPAYPYASAPLRAARSPRTRGARTNITALRTRWRRSEEHTSELQSRVDLVCRLLLEKKKYVQIFPRFFFLSWVRSSISK